MYGVTREDQTKNECIRSSLEVTRTVDKMRENSLMYRTCFKEIKYRDSEIIDMEGNVQKENDRKSDGWM